MGHCSACNHFSGRLSIYMAPVSTFHDQRVMGFHPLCLRPISAPVREAVHNLKPFVRGSMMDRGCGLIK